MVVTKQVNTTPNDPTFGVGETISYTIRITNTGGVMLTVVPLEDRYSDVFLTFVSASVPPDGSSGNGLLVWSDVTTVLGNITPGASVSLVVTFTTEADTTLLAPVSPCTTSGHTPNIVDIQGALADPDGDDGNANDDVAVVKDADDHDCAEVQILNPTGLLLATSSVQQAADGVLVSWTMVDESNIVGFYVWRTGGGMIEERSNGLIPTHVNGVSRGLSGLSSQNRYEWLDAGETLKSQVAYELEIVYTDGTSERAAIDIGGSSILYMPLISK